ncbi:putative regulatory protein, FmdB family [Micromonospora pattaloongensis]|uniref:Putative regulatory protein, FmdB family n=1 Tax=Micromonospora pattaloongensis TaxID=405436 RepID=A0A1H3GPC5_9ACTN|nr:putative regulatory protein, FmdB family [Micromonospora pattaloongensis]
MPTYQYACTACGNNLEAVQSFADEPLTECPACQGKLRKLFNSVGIVFKGSGFYRTDSRNGSSGSSSTSSVESKPAAKPAASNGSSSSSGDSAAKAKPAASSTTSSSAA